jgi:hypothetical protein
VVWSNDKTPSLIKNGAKSGGSQALLCLPVYDLWTKYGPDGSKRWSTHEQLADALGKSTSWVDHNIEVAKTRKQEKIRRTFSTSTIKDTLGLETKERQKLLEKVEEEEIPESKVAQYAKAVKEAEKSPEVKKAILESPKRITPVVAKQILELPKEKREAPAVKQAG